MTTAINVIFCYRFWLGFQDNNSEKETRLIKRQQNA